MRRAIALMIVATAAAAHASPSELPAAPTGWTIDATRAGDLDARLRAAPHFGGAEVTAIATRVAVQDGNALALWRIEAAAPDLARGVRAELDQIHAAAGAAPPELAVWQERVVDRVAEANLAWRRAGDRSDVRTRVLISARGGTAIAIGGECAIRDGAAPAARATCEHALDALVADVPVAERAELAAAPAAASPTPPAMTEAAPVARAAPPSMREGDSLPRVAPPPPPPSETDRRPFLVAGGALVLALLLLWNRSQRRAIEAAHGPTAPRRRFRAREAAPPRDDDGDALADAADAADAADGAADADGAAAADAPGAPRPAAPTIKDPP